MRLIEPHIHTVSRTTDDLYRMALAGIVAGVGPSFWSGVYRGSPEEDDALRRQLRMAEERFLPVTVRSARHNGKKCMERVISIIEDEQVTQERSVIDHAPEETAARALEKTGCWAGLAGQTVET